MTQLVRSFRELSRVLKEVVGMRLLIAFFIVFAGLNGYAEATDYQAKGNLESPKPAGCVSVEDISSSQNPADIFHGVSKCISKRKYERGSELYLLAMAYGRYDSLRVEDTTSHQAISVLRRIAFSRFDEHKMNAFQEALKSTDQDNMAFCRSIRALGMPEYYPRYMIQHGMGAFLGQKSKDGLVGDFDSEKAWEEILSESLHCTK
jgi:hypothetical protein